MEALVFHMKHSCKTILFRYELFVDDLPVWGFVGPPPEESKDKQGHVWTHKSFDIDYNDNRVCFSCLEDA